MFNFINNFLKLDSQIFIIKIDIWTIIIFANNIKIILKLVKLIDLIIFFFLPFFYIKQLFSNGISINIISKLKNLMI